MPNRVDDIEFVTQISTSLLAQVRQLQAVLAERDETVKSLNLERTRLELDAQGLSQRIRGLNESEQRYKDENWSLETQTHDLIAAAKESAARDQRLQQSLAVANSEKSAAQRDLDDIRQAHGKLAEDHAAIRKTHESEVASLRKSALIFEADKSSLQQQIKELRSQNQELANAVAGSFVTASKGVVAEPEEFSLDNSAPEEQYSPPPSPSKGTVRNSMLESETLKSSLHHAHRMIQNLKSSIHREKTEKQELKRMLQESRDELELRRSEAVTAPKRLTRKSQHDQAKKMSRIGQLGTGRTVRTDIEVSNAGWEEQREEPLGSPKSSRSLDSASALDSGATETEDAFETANELETNTETEAFQTGNESLAGESSDDMTETESGAVRYGGNQTAKRPSTSKTKRSSYISTASTSDDEHGREMETPTAKYRIRLSRGSHQTESPASFRSNKANNGPSLFAELGDFGEDSGDDAGGTPVRSTRSSAAKDDSVQRHNNQVDSGMMTEPWQPVFPLAESLLASSTANNNEEKQAGQIAISEALSRSSIEDSLSHTPPLAASRDVSENDTGTSSLDPDHVLAMGEEPQLVVTKTPFTFSTIRSLERSPYQQDKPNFEIETPTVNSLAPCGDEANDMNKPGVLDSVLGWAVGKKQSPQISEDNTSKDTVSSSTITAKNTRAPFREKSSNVAAGHAFNNEFQNYKLLETADQSSQTMLSASEVDNLLSLKGQKAAASIPRTASGSLVLSNGIKNSSKISPALSTKASGSHHDVAPPLRSLKRPGSSGSIRTSDANIPPLPTDHRQAIAAAQQGPSKEKAEGLMGPPAAPASAYRHSSKRPQTPSNQTVTSPSSTTPRARYSTARSARSRRSSMSSFESELDARFNIRADGMPLVQAMENGNTDPRMIQAITQTMIGEYLWKYTRKAGRGEMSDKRHRRFFWVHPYTRTLYWSNQDPSTAGRAQLKAKSVAIEAVRVVVDDNPMPPGLHRKSLIVITPGRDVKFTATTGQRHETWFNSLSYLLLRSGADAQYADSTGLTAEDVAEFNPGFRTSSRVSLSSYNSRTNTTQHSSRTASPTKASARRIPATPHASTSSRNSNANHSSIGSRFSNYWRGTKSSMANNRTSTGSASIYNASVVNDSAEDVRQVLEKQEQEADRLENVRACCDGAFMAERAKESIILTRSVGKHDVGSLNRRTATIGRLGSTSRHTHHAH